LRSRPIGPGSIRTRPQKYRKCTLPASVCCCEKTDHSFPFRAIVLAANHRGSRRSPNQEAPFARFHSIQASLYRTCKLPTIQCVNCQNLFCLKSTVSSRVAILELDTIVPPDIPPISVRRIRQCLRSGSLALSVRRNLPDFAKAHTKSLDLRTNILPSARFNMAGP